MPYAVIEHFQNGLDSRRLLETTQDNSLVKAVNCHITRGGEIEKRKAFVPLFSLPPGTVGLYMQDGPIYNVWGTGEKPDNLPWGVKYWRLTREDASNAALTRILDVEEFYGNLYVVAEFADGEIRHYWRNQEVTGTRPEEPDGLPEPEPPPDQDPGNTTLTVSVSDVSRTYTDGPDELIWGPVRVFPSGGTNPYSFEFVPGVYLFGESEVEIELVDTGPNGEVANEWEKYVRCKALVATENAGPAKRMYLVNVTDADGNTGTDSFGVWFSFVKTDGGDGLPDLPPGTTDPKIIAMGDQPGLSKPYGLIASSDTWAPGIAVMAADEKMYGVYEHYLNFSKLGDPLDWDPLSAGAGFIDMSNEMRGRQDLMGMAPFRNAMAIFARRSIAIWLTDPDPAQNSKLQILQNTGTSAPRSILPMGAGDVLYLDLDGIRNLRERTNSENAYAGDIGSKIDRLVQERLRAIGDVEASKAIGVIDPESGRAWMIVGNVIFVLSYYPEERIYAWTIYDPGFVIEYASTSSTSVFVRSGDTVYCYGGLDRFVYDDCLVEFQIPFMDIGKAATDKMWTGLDAALQGTWEVHLHMSIQHPSVSDLVGILMSSTYSMGNIPTAGASTHFSVRMRNQSNGYARVGNMAIHYEDGHAA